jgi:hypothetical protein
MLIKYRPVDPNMPNTPHRLTSLQPNQLKFYPPANITNSSSILQKQEPIKQSTSNYLNMMNFQSSNNTYSNQSLLNSNSTNNINSDMFRKDTNVLLKRGYISP